MFAPFTAIKLSFGRKVHFCLTTIFCHFANFNAAIIWDVCIYLLLGYSSEDGLFLPLFTQISITLTITSPTAASNLKTLLEKSAFCCIKMFDFFLVCLQKPRVAAWVNPPMTKAYPSLRLIL